MDPQISSKKSTLQEKYHFMRPPNNVPGTLAIYLKRDTSQIFLTFRNAEAVNSTENAQPKKVT